MQQKDKKLLRKEYKIIRSSVKDREVKEMRILENIIQSSIFKNAPIVFAYAASGSEANIDGVINFALSQGKKIALPVCSDSNGNMDFYYIKSSDDLIEGMYSIREPDVTKCEKAYPDPDSLCIVPAICFDTKGNRIGYGKGYYDRFLNKFNGCTAGVNYDECVTDEIPSHTFDEKVTYLITDKKIYNFSK